MAGMGWRYSIVLSLLLAPALVAAAQFRVGGQSGWTVPANPNTMPYNDWAQKMRLKIGDSIVFVYQSNSDSVLQVSKEDYDSCNTKNPIARFNDGNTVFTFTQSGPYYFISGSGDNCSKNEKVVVVVMADRSGSNSGQPAAGTTPSAPAQQGQSSPTTQPPSNVAHRDAAGVIVAGAFLGASALFLI